MSSQLINQRTGACIVTTVKIADSFYSRCRGLLGKKMLAENEALIIRPCKQVHMFFMKFAIDVIFCDSEFAVIHIEHQLKPWKISRHVSTAVLVIEVATGLAKKLDLHVGDRLVLSNKN